jgi:heptose I phosphotransferase
MEKNKLIRISKTVLADSNYAAALKKLGLTSIDAVFDFNIGQDLDKADLAAFRKRRQFEITQPQSQSPVTVFLKRYDRPPFMLQLMNWFWNRGRKSIALADATVAQKLHLALINTPKTVACGEQWEWLFERRSFIMTAKIPNAQSLEARLPDCFNQPVTSKGCKARKKFIAQTAAFIRKFHNTGYRHRDLYLCHIFLDDNGELHLIDLARVFKPVLLAERFRIKDITQVYYSAPAACFSATDRLRFYLAYTGHTKLTHKDKVFIKKVLGRANRMARHDRKRGRGVPFADR